MSTNYGAALIRHNIVVAPALKKRFSAGQAASAKLAAQ
jgi:hypothetical protein